jgi:hypothetical protein
MTDTKSLAYRLAYIADLEATFTASFKFLLDNEDIMFRPGGDRVASLLLWHMVEEVEHRSSAVIINAVVGKRMYSLGALPSVIRHIMGTLVPIYVDGMNTNVPEKDRVLDLRVMSVSWRVRTQVCALVSRGRLIRTTPPPMLKAVDRKGKRQALRGLVLSQNPYFDPAHEAIPSFAGKWFDRFERGDDVTHWYGSQSAV